MKRFFTRCIGFMVFALVSCSRKTLAPVHPPAEPWLAVNNTIPVSEISIPIRLPLQPLYDLAEKYIDKEFTSEGWPGKWVYDGCTMRYMYHFRRDPLQITVSGRKASMDFTCHYQVKGAQRACVGGVSVTPWSPACTCGMNGEPERRIRIGFNAEFFVNQQYTAGAYITAKEPETPDACEVCFFRTNITPIIVGNIKPQLDTALTIARAQFGSIALKPYVQQFWQQLQQPVNLGGYGYLHIRPQAVLLNRLSAGNQYLEAAIGLTAQPLVSFEKQELPPAPLPPLTGGNRGGGFMVFADAQLRYDSLGLLLNRHLAGTRIELEKGVMGKKYIDIEQIELQSRGGNRIMVKMQVSGSAKGTVFLTGTPAYDSATQSLYVQNLDYELGTKNMLLKTAGWLLDKKITRKLADAARFELKAYLLQLQTRVNPELNRDLGKGVRTTGSLNELSVVEIVPQPGYLFIRLRAAGGMEVQLTQLPF